MKLYKTLSERISKRQGGNKEDQEGNKESNKEKVPRDGFNETNADEAVDVVDAVDADGVYIFI